MATPSTDLMNASSRSSVTSGSRRRSSITITQEDEDALQALIFDTLEDGGHHKNSGSHLKNAASPFNSSDPKKQKPPRKSSKSEHKKAGLRKMATNPEGSAIKTSTQGRRNSGSKDVRKSTGSAAAPAPHDILRMLEAQAERGNDAEAGEFLQFLKTNPLKSDMVGSEELTLGSEEFNLAVNSEEAKRGRRGSGGLRKVEEEPSKDRISRRDRKPRSKSPKKRSQSPKGSGSNSPPKSRDASPKRSLSPIPRLLGGLGFRKQATNPDAYSKVSNTLRRTVTNPEGGPHAATAASGAATTTKTKRPVRKTKSSREKETKPLQSPQQVLEMLEMCASSGDPELAGAYMQKLKEKQDPSDKSDQQRRRRK